MSDSRRVYRAIHAAITQLYPAAARGNRQRHLTTLAALVTGIVRSRSCQLPKIASEVPGRGLDESRVKQFSRWTQNDAVAVEWCFLPFAEALLQHLAGCARPEQPLALMMDGSEVGRGCLALMVSVLYAGRALPVAWVVSAGTKGHFPEATHVALLAQVSALLPDDTPAVFLGDGEFDGIQLHAAIWRRGWHYVCRTAKNAQILVDGTWLSLADLAVCRGRKKFRAGVGFTAEGFGPVQVLAWWEGRFTEPIYLVSDLLTREELCRWYRKRMHIETLFSDQKSRGFHLHLSHLSDPERVSRLMIAACLAYLWIVYLGQLVLQQGWLGRIHRASRCDLSLFQLGLRLLTYLLKHDRRLPVAFLPLPKRAQIVTV